LHGNDKIQGGARLKLNGVKDNPFRLMATAKNGWIRRFAAVLMKIKIAGIISNHRDTSQKPQKSRRIASQALLNND
jgi:hypothetical protein